MDLENIEGIKSWPVPKNVSEVISFIRLARYYRKFIEGLSKPAHPITSLQKKKIEFELNTKCEKSFHYLKELLTNAPILNVAYHDEYFVVCMDACKEGFGGFLTQNGNFICNESRKLKEHERDYATCDLDLTSIV